MNHQKVQIVKVASLSSPLPSQFIPFFQVGDSVYARVVQYHENEDWRADEITIITSTWEHQAQNEAKEIDLDVLQSEVVIGKVTLLRSGIGRIDKDIAFAVDECKDGYAPMIGDWVCANVTEHEEKNGKYLFFCFWS